MSRQTAGPGTHEIAELRAKLAAMREPLWMLREEHEAETAELRARLEAAEAVLYEAQPALRDAGHLDLLAQCARHTAELKNFDFEEIDKRIRTCAGLARKVSRILPPVPLPETEL